MLQRSSGLDSTLKLSKQRKVSVGLRLSSVRGLAVTKCRGSYWSAERLSASQEGFLCMDLVNLQITASLLLCRDRHFVCSWCFGLPSRKTYRSCQKHESVSLHGSLSTVHLPCVSLIRSLKSNLCTAVITLDTTENKCMTSHAQNTTAL